MLKKRLINNSVVTENIGDIEFEESYDLAVVGLGAAGAVATLVAAKRGLKVLAIERLNGAGGTMTMTGITGYYFGNPGGAFDEIDRNLMSLPDTVVKDRFLHPDFRKYNLDLLLEKAEVDVSYESVVTALFCHGKKICGVNVFDGEKHRRVGTKAVIDATGEAQICRMAECKMTFGRDFDQSVVPFTISKCFLINGMIEKTNPDSGKTDHRNPQAFSRAVLEGQSFYARTLEGKRTLKLHPLPGIREGALLEGEKRITVKNLLEGEPEKEPVIFAYADLDKHGPDVAFDSDVFKKWDLMCNLGALNVTVPIPKECLIAKEYDNLCVAGRSLSVDHELQTCVRMNRDMQKLGEVAAVLVSLALETDIPLKAVEYKELLPILKASGCYREDNNRGFWYDAGLNAPENYIRPANWLKDPKEINLALSSLKPGVAMWSCKLLGESIKPVLRGNLSGGDENLVKHSAIALALTGDDTGAEVLREMVKSYDFTPLEDMRKHNKIRLPMAVCSLGMIRDEASIEILKALILDRSMTESYPETYRNKNGFKEQYYRTVSVAVWALTRLAESYPKRKEEIKDFLEKEFYDLSYIKRMTAQNEHSDSYAMCYDIYKYIYLWSKGIVK